MSILTNIQLYRSSADQADAKQLLEHIEFIHLKAKEAVALGDGTLNEANNTYFTLAGEWFYLYIHNINIIQYC